MYIQNVLSPCAFTPAHAYILGKDGLLILIAFFHNEHSLGWNDFSTDKYTPLPKKKKNKIKFADKNTSDTSYGFIKFRVTTLIWNIKLIIIMLKQFLYTFMVFGIETQLYHSLILINIV